VAFPTAKKFDKDSYHIILPVAPPEIPDDIRIAAKDRGLAAKTEFHISVAVTKNAKKIHDTVTKKGDPTHFREAIQSFMNGLAWEYTPTDEYAILEMHYDHAEMKECGYSGLPLHSRKTLVHRVDMPDMKVFYEKLSKLLEVPFGVPVPHITLFAWSDYAPFMTRGIGIASEDEYLSVRKAIL
jgi:hypothetical protein